MHVHPAATMPGGNVVTIATAVLLLLLVQQDDALRVSRQLLQRRRTTTTPPPAELVDSNGSPVNCPCFSTNEFNPVCGTNRLTYGNLAKLTCARRCRHNVELAYYGSCEGSG